MPTPAATNAPPQAQPQASAVQDEATGFEAQAGGHSATRHAQGIDPTTPQSLTPASIKAAPVRPQRGGLLTQLEDLDAVEVAKPKDETEATLPPEAIDEAAFAKALELFVATQVGDRKMLGTVLLTGHHTFEMNMWRCTVVSDINRIELERNRDELVAYLRAETGNRTLQLEIVVDKTLAPKVMADRPLTAEERLQKAMQLNPHFRTLVERLKLRISYDNKG